MENASKALIMAGEILIALLIISMIVYAYSQWSNMENTGDKSKEAEQLAVFNKEYESYNRKLLRGVDVITVINKAIDNNKKYGNDEYYNIKVEFRMANELIYKKDGTSAENKFNKIQDYNIDQYQSMANDKDAFTDFKRRIFDCDKVDYGSESGRINYMHFTERKMSDDSYINGL